MPKAPEQAISVPDPRGSTSTLDNFRAPLAAPTELMSCQILLSARDIPIEKVQVGRRNNS
jgi:hypothetical protein